MSAVDWDAFNRDLDVYLEDQHEAYLLSQMPPMVDELPIDGTHPICIGCAKRPTEIGEYTSIAIGEEIFDTEGKPDPTAACIREEGTFNHTNGHFWCTSCYIKAGQPLGVAP